MAPNVGNFSQKSDKAFFVGMKKREFRAWTFFMRNQPSLFPVTNGGCRKAIFLLV